MNNAPKNEEKSQADKNKHLVKMMVIELATEFALLIAVPIIGLVYLGKWLDNKYDTKFFVILGFFLALTISSVSIGKRINRIRKRLK